MAGEAEETTRFLVTWEQSVEAVTHIDAADQMYRKALAGRATLFTVVDEPVAEGDEGITVDLGALLDEDDALPETVKALFVLVLDHKTRPWLELNDPMALQQAEQALITVGHGARLADAHAEPNFGEGDRVVDVRYGTSAVVKHLDRSQRGSDGYGVVLAYDDEPDMPVATGSDYFRKEPLRGDAPVDYHAEQRRMTGKVRSYDDVQ